MIAGPFQVDYLNMGHIRLDGGAMFGVVPKVLWSRTNPPDEKNRIDLACRGLLLRGDGRTVVVDTGAGSRWTDKERSRYGMSDRDVVDALHDYGLTPGDVTDVLLTHLHFDHAGGAVTPDEKPTFPNAEYVVQERALEWARNPTDRDRASFRKGDFEPLCKAGQLRCVDGELEVLANIRVLLSEGHTTALQIPVIGETVIYPADLIPTSTHLPPAWVMAYDIRPTVSVAEKKKVLDMAVDQQWTVVFEHDPVIAAATIEKSEGRYAVRAVVS
ncbi:MAG TPA: MBL fold metallo-hydrolase [Myxococcales bacterium]|nr:MBL fold metallo-hydrolase [Myxococcales bacterium]HIN84991.1 MBL fold metallo-hydrolase [Myxococcales bacterium]